MSEPELARLNARLEELQRHLARLEANLDRNHATLGERDDEIHVLLRDMALTKSEQSMKLEQLTLKVRELRERSDEIEDDNTTIKAQLKNMTLVFNAARWFLMAAIPILLSSAISVAFRFFEQ